MASGCVRTLAGGTADPREAREAAAIRAGTVLAVRGRPEMQMPARKASAQVRSVVLLVGTSAVWPEELAKLLGPDEWDFIVLKDLEDVPSQLRSRAVHGVIMTPRSWSARELVVLRECRSDSPDTAMVVMAEDPVGPALKRALENGAT